jgi:hypothetical protein
MDSWLTQGSIMRHHQPTLISATIQPELSCRIIEYITHNANAWNAEKLDAIDLDIRLQAHN